MSYTVKSGDNLWNIAMILFGDGNKFTEIKRENNLTSDTIFPGQVLKIPGKLPKIAKRHNTNEISTAQLITKSQFLTAFPSGYNQIDKYDGFLNACQDADINQIDEAAMFLAHLFHESAGLSKTKESDPESLRISTKLYGVYIGRGYIQLSHRANYEAASNALGVDYVNNPSLVENDPHAWKVTSWYWRTEVHKYVPKGFHATTKYGIRAELAHGGSRDQIYRHVCNAFGIQPRF